VKSYACNNARRADELRQEYVVLRQNYCGFPIIDNDHFDTKMVSKIIFDIKRGKAADVYGLTVEHLQYSHPVMSVLLSKFFLLITLCGCIPNGFKRTCSYIVSIPKV